MNPFILSAECLNREQVYLVMHMPATAILSKQMQCAGNSSRKRTRLIEITSRSHEVIAFRGLRLRLTDIKFCIL